MFCLYITDKLILRFRISPSFPKPLGLSPLAPKRGFGRELFSRFFWAEQARKVGLCCIEMMFFFFFFASVFFLGGKLSMKYKLIIWFLWRNLSDFESKKTASSGAMASTSGLPSCHRGEHEPMGV